MFLDPVSLMKPYRPTSSHHHARRPLLPTWTWLNIAAITETTATPQRNVKHSKTRFKSWFVLATSTASSVETTSLPDPITLLVLTTDALLTILTTTNVQSSPLTATRNRLAPISPLPTPLHDTINTISGDFAIGGSTSSAKKRHLHKRRLPWPWSPAGWPHGHHRWVRKLCRQESPHWPRQFRRHPLLGNIPETPTPHHRHSPIRWTDIWILRGKVIHPWLHRPSYHFSRWRSNQDNTYPIPHR